MRRPRSSSTTGPTAGELTQPAGPVTARNAPAIVKAAGKAAEFAWEEFFQAELANAHTRKNYMHAVRRFLAWVEDRGLELPRVAPGDVGEYLQGLELAVADQEAPPGRPAAVLRPPGQPPRLRHQPGRHRQVRAVRGRRGQDARDRPRPGPDAPEVHRRLEPGRPPRPRGARCPHLYGRPRRRRRQAHDEEPQARRDPVRPAVLREGRQVARDPGAARPGAVPARLRPGRRHRRGPPLPHGEPQDEDAHQERR